MTRRYLVTVKDEYARVLDGWLDYEMRLVPSGAPAGVPVAAVEAVPDDPGSVGAGNVERLARFTSRAQREAQALVESLQRIAQDLQEMGGTKE